MVVMDKREEQLNQLYKWLTERENMREFKDWIRRRYEYIGKDENGRDIYRYSHLWCECDALLSNYLYFLLGSGLSSSVYREMPRNLKNYLIELMREEGIADWDFQLSCPDDAYWGDYYIYLYT